MIIELNTTFNGRRRCGAQFCETCSVMCVPEQPGVVNSSAGPIEQIGSNWSDSRNAGPDGQCYWWRKPK